MTKTERIAELNDQARASMDNLTLSAGVEALPAGEQWRIREKVRAFRDFTEGEDPYGERQGGSFEHGELRIAWRVAYYGDGMRLPGRYNDPSDPAKSARALTIRLASEPVLRRLRVTTEPSGRKERVWLKAISDDGVVQVIQNIARIEAVFVRNRWLEKFSGDYDEVIAAPMRMSTAPPAVGQPGS